MIEEMAYPYFSHNGEILPLDQAAVPLSRVEYSYGFGVYESIRVTRGKGFFLEDHCQRLLQSAELIGLKHSFSTDLVQQYVLELVQRNEVEACNVKIILTGASTADAATLDILCLNPLFPDRKLYKTGTKAITYHYERAFPQAKTLNMLQSYLAYRDALAAGAYDALFINRNDCITEGTRTNFFGLRGKTLVSPPAEQILLGVTRDKVLQVARTTGFEVTEQNIKQSELNTFDSVFLTSTSSKIMPLNMIDEQSWSISTELRALMQAFDHFLERT